MKPQKRERLRIVAVRRPQPDLQKLARALLALAAERDPAVQPDEQAAS